MTYSAGSEDVGEYLVTARSFAEYCAMFDLEPGNLPPTILDCPGGASSFAAEAAGHGVHVTAVDPVYADRPADLARRARAEVDRGTAWTTATSDRFVWDFYGDPDNHRRMRLAAVDAFADDLLARPDRYLAAGVPNLPFAARTFDLVLSSHLLFTYADRLDAQFHRAALAELARVTRAEVRVFPLVDQAGRALDRLVDQLRQALAADGIESALHEVAYEFQRGAHTMLVLRAG